MKSELFENIVDLIREILGESNINITEETRFFEDLEFDSISTIQLLVLAEENFGFDSEDSEESLYAFETDRAFVDFVEKMLRGKSNK